MIIAEQFFLETFPECSLPSTVLKNVIIVARFYSYPNTKYNHRIDTVTENNKMTNTGMNIK